MEVRQPDDLAGLAGLVIPGGESTTMANIAERNGLVRAPRRTCIKSMDCYVKMHIDHVHSHCHLSSNFAEFRKAMFLAGKILRILEPAKGHLYSRVASDIRDATIGD